MAKGKRIKGKYEAKITYDFDFEENDSDLEFEGCKRQVEEELTKWIREELEFLIDEDKGKLTVEQISAELHLE